MIYTITQWDKWKASYFQQVTVYGFADLSSDGLMAAMGNFTFRTLAAGDVKPLPEGGHRITIRKVAIIVWDSFNFDGEYDLKYWSCKEKAFSVTGGDATSSYFHVTNGSFQEFRKKYGLGEDFLVLSQPKIVDNIGIMIYDTQL